MAFFTLTRLSSIVDGYVREFTLKDETPDALGELRIDPPGPLAAGSRATLRVTFTVGSLPMQPGGALLIGTQYMGDQGTRAARGPGRRRLRLDRVVESRRALRADQGAARRDFTAASWSSARRRRTVWSVPRCSPATPSPSPTAIDRGARAASRCRPSPPTRWCSRSTSISTARDASSRRAGRAFPSSAARCARCGRWRRRWSIAASRSRSACAARTRSTTAPPATIPAYRVLLDGKPVGEVAASQSAIATVPDLKIDAPGVHRFTVVSADGAIRATSNPIRVRASAARAARAVGRDARPLAATPKGRAPPPATSATPRRTRASTSRRSPSTTSGWTTTSGRRCRSCRGSRPPTATIAFLGYEWTAVRSRGGHHNVLFRTPDHERVPVQEAGRLAGALRGAAPRGRSQGRGGDPARAHGRRLDARATPISSGWPRSTPCTAPSSGSATATCSNGFEVGFVGASDDHRAQPGAPHGLFRLPLAGQGGLAAVLAPERDARRDLRRAARALGLRHLGRAHPARRAPQRTSRWARASRTLASARSSAGSTAPRRSTASTWCATARSSSAGTT